MSRPVVLVESPYAGNPDSLRYLACCLLDSILRGESPIASHAIGPLALPEHCESYGGRTGREIGLECRDALAALPGVKCVRYTDLGITPGMIRGGTWLPSRELEGEALRVWDRGEWPSPARLTHNHDVDTQASWGEERAALLEENRKLREVIERFHADAKSFHLLLTTGPWSTPRSQEAEAWTAEGVEWASVNLRTIEQSLIGGEVKL